MLELCHLIPKKCYLNYKLWLMNLLQRLAGLARQQAILEALKHLIIPVR